MTHHIHRVAVLGAGTMGAAIAAQAANAGLSADLLDIVPPGAHGKERNNIVKAGWAGFATEYDGVVAEQLAGAQCGGELSSPQ